jgi:hypothetical protein
MTLTLDQAHRECVERLPRSWRALARELPFRVGISPRAPGSFADYATLDPIVDLPGLVAPEVEPHLLHAYQRAHLFGGFFGLLRDRLWDGEAPDHAGLHALIPLLRAQWRAATIAAHGAPGVVDALVAHTDARAWWAHRVEMRLRTKLSMRLRTYATLVVDKTAWFGVAARLLVRRFRGREVAQAFEQARSLLMLSLQAPDDAADAASDRDTKGFDFPSALGVSGAVLFRAGAVLSSHLAERARHGAFPGLASWAAARADQLAATRLRDEGPVDAVLAVALGQSLATEIADRKPEP